MAATRASASERAYGGLTRSERIAQREQRLLASALELFSRQGYAHTSIEQLCADAKVTARHFYESHDSKEALLLTLYRRITGELSLAVSVAMQAGADTLEAQVSAAVDALLTHYLTDDRLARIGVLEVVGVSPAMEQERRATIHAMARVAEGFIGQRLSAPIPARQAQLSAIALVGGINELMADWLTRPDPCELPALADEIRHIALALLRGLQPAAHHLEN